MAQRYLRLVASLAAFGLLLSCSNKAKTLSQQGLCGGVSTYTLLAQWKKLSSTADDEQPSDDTLEFNYDILLFEPGAVACVTHVVNKNATSAAFKGIYAHEPQERKVTLQYVDHEIPSLKNKSQIIRYSFAGQCQDTRMTLSYDDGTVETYKIHSTKVATGNCNLE
jgi:hypothetical protein